MFTTALHVERGKCTRCGKAKAQVGPLYVLDLTHGQEAKLVETEADAGACDQCWRKIGLDIEKSTRILKIKKALA